MDLELGEEQELLREGLRQLLDKACDVKRVRSVAYEGDGRDAELWRELVASGWTSMTVPESAGGGGQGFEEAVVVAMEAGRALVHVPLVETLLVARCLARQAAAAQLEEIAHGSSASLAVAEISADYAEGGATLAAERSQGDWRLHGEHHGVPHGPLADRLLVEASCDGGGRALFVIPGQVEGIAWTEVGTLDRTQRRYRLRAERLRLPAQACVAQGSGVGLELEGLLDEWRVLMAAQTQGASRQLLEMTVDYAKKREQFGRPVGSNQAVKVRLAEVAAQVERMQVAIYYAGMKIGQEAPDRALAAAMAKAATAAPGSFVATQAVHVHGAIGYTWEQDVHLYVSRIKTHELLLGSEHESLERIAAQVL